ncbi:MAG: hypothetical protein U0263_11355 [Polyangiaceae bacterium]
MFWGTARDTNTCCTQVESCARHVMPVKHWVSMSLSTVSPSGDST